jgi:group I intron endonuclease
MACGLIYCATNMVNKKQYIGQTINSLKTRIRKHQLKAIKNIDNNHFLNALRKYGIDNFIWEILSYATTKYALDQAEIYWIGYYDTLNNGYNHKEGGANGKFSIEAKRKMSDSHRGIKLSSETAEKISKANKGKNHYNYGKHRSEETKQKISQSLMGNVVSEETKKKIGRAFSGENSPNYGRIHSEETRAKMAKAAKDRIPWNKGTKGIMIAWNKGMKMSKEMRKKLSDAHKGKIVSSDTKNKISIATRKRWADPEYRQKTIEAIRRAKARVS